MFWPRRLDTSAMSRPDASIIDAAPCRRSCSRIGRRPAATASSRNLVTQYHRLLERAGLPHKRFHDLRHTCASLLLVQGEDIRVAMEVLGHS